MKFLKRIWCWVVGHEPVNTDWSRKRDHPDYCHTWECFRCGKPYPQSCHKPLTKKEQAE